MNQCYELFFGTGLDIFINEILTIKFENIPLNNLN